MFGYNSQTIRVLRMIASLWQSIFGQPVVDKDEFIRFTYRSHIEKQLPTTTYTSDSGWGCMLRVLQMAIANLLQIRQQAHPRTIIPLFWDNSIMPFSIQSLSQVSAELFPSKKANEWYSPSEAGFLMQAVLQRFNLTYRVVVCNDGSIFLNQLPRDKENLVVLVMARIGLDKPEPQYLEALIQIMGTKYFFAILGGTPRYAHLFLKYKEGYMGFLDPHQTKRAQKDEEQLLSHLYQYSGKLEWIKKEKISSSMCIMFAMDNKNIDDFWGELKKVKEKCGDGFFLYVAEEKPVYSPSNVIQILQFE